MTIKGHTVINDFFDKCKPKTHDLSLKISKEASFRLFKDNDSMEGLYCLCIFVWLLDI
jgi:hypothetical protein